MIYNPVLCILSPRDIEEALDAFNKVNNIDRLYIKYFTPEQDAYEAMRNWFLQHTEYTHLMTIADDCIIKPEHIESLKKGIIENDFQVLTGFANVNITDKKNIYTIALKEIPIERHKRGNSFEHLLTHKDMFSDAGICYFGKYFKVKWCGLGLTCIRRDVVNLIEFQDDSIPNGMKPKDGCCTDTYFSYMCNKLNIPIYCDSSVKIYHLRKTDSSLMENFYAGVKPRKLVFIPKS